MQSPEAQAPKWLLGYTMQNTEVVLGLVAGPF